MGRANKMVLLLLLLLTALATVASMPMMGRLTSKEEGLEAVALEREVFAVQGPSVLEMARSRRSGTAESLRFSTTTTTTTTLSDEFEHHPTRSHAGSGSHADQVRTGSRKGKERVEEDISSSKLKEETRRKGEEENSVGEEKIITIDEVDPNKKQDVGKLMERYLEDAMRVYEENRRKMTSRPGWRV
ncbi:hypothetical protein IE53DRAFT_390590 [Violaceomyces palustris]|uniref:Uncharacterized protein n=1 Tax=Violaceomyces palustris TaxID=1673888 RepID=A0ACD0NN66_9BASI|nr:hypothetical protein IE53DRAFT_390590 [Violaceomyces palustris]